MAAERPVFLYDLSSPECWLVAERINGELPVVPVWQPVFLPAVLAGRPGGAERRGDEPQRKAAVEREASAQGLPEVRWPEPFPAHTETAMRAAVFAQASGRAVAFSLAAFRQAFAAGRDLAVTDNVLLAAAACELHPRAVLKGVESRAVERRLAEACADAAAAGVEELPALRAGDEVLTGSRLLAPLATRPRRPR